MGLSFEANLARQRNAVFHIDTTSALEALERTPAGAPGSEPATYPFGE